MFFYTEVEIRFEICDMIAMILGLWDHNIGNYEGKKVPSPEPPQFHQVLFQARPQVATGCCLDFATCAKIPTKLRALLNEGPCLCMSHCARVLLLSW